MEKLKTMSTVSSEVFLNFAVQKSIIHLLHSYDVCFEQVVPANGSIVHH